MPGFSLDVFVREIQWTRGQCASILSYTRSRRPINLLLLNMIKYESDRHLSRVFVCNDGTHVTSTQCLEDPTRIAFLDRIA